MSLRTGDIYYFCEDEQGLTGIYHPDDEAADDGLIILGTMERLAQWDQGLCPADETAYVVLVKALAWAGVALGRMANDPAAHEDGSYWPVHYGEPAAEIVRAEFAYRGDGWCEPTEDDPDCERGTWMVEEAERIASELGLILEWDGDTGTVSLYLPLDGAS